MQPRKWFRRGTWKLFQYLPEKIRHRIIRRSFPVSHELISGLEFKIAETQEELEAAYNLVYEEYLSSGLTEANEAGMRMSKFHALPGTTVIIGKIDGEIICTLSVIHDGPIGLPMDYTWDLDPIRFKAARIAEISSMAIKKNAQGRRGGILLPLCKFMYQFCTEYAGVEIIVISTINIVRDFYSAILLFETLGDTKPKPHGYTQGVTAYAQYLDYRTAPERYRKVYDHLEDKYNLYKFFKNTDSSKHFRFPSKAPAQCVYPVMTPDLLNYFFNKSLPIFKNLKPEERDYIRTTYYDQAYLKVLGSDQETFTHSRRDKRYPVHCSAILTQPNSNVIQKAVVLEIAKNGLGLRLTEPIPIGKITKIALDWPNSKKIQLEAIPRWKSPELSYGFQIVQVAYDDWKTIIDRLETTFQAKDPGKAIRLKKIMGR